MTQSSGSNYQPVTSQAEMYNAFVYAESEMTQYAGSQSTTVQNLGSLQSTITNKERSQASHMIGLAQKDAKAMQIAIGVGAALSVLGGALSNATMFDGPGMLDHEAMMTKASVAGNMMSAGSQAITQTTQGIFKAQQQKATGELTQTQAAASLSDSMSEQVDQRQQISLQAAEEVGATLSAFISGRTQASNTLRG